MIPGLEKAEFIKYGVMHRNTYINSPTLLDQTYNLKSNTNIYFAGQITGVEGYVESISSGMVAALNAVNQLEKNRTKKTETEKTKEKFQPMNANFGILPELEGKKIKDKKERYLKLAERSLLQLIKK